MKPIFLLAASLIVTLAGCSHTVIVRGDDGVAVSDAVVRVQSLSINYAGARTNAGGKAKLNRFYPQRPQWLIVSKSGYVLHRCPFPKTWPYTVFLLPAPEGYEDKVYDPFVEKMEDRQLFEQDASASSGAD